MIFTKDLFAEILSAELKAATMADAWFLNLQPVKSLKPLLEFR